MTFSVPLNFVEAKKVGVFRKRLQHVLHDGLGFQYDDGNVVEVITSPGGADRPPGME